MESRIRRFGLGLPKHLKIPSGMTLRQSEVLRRSRVVCPMDQMTSWKSQTPLRFSRGVSQILDDGEAHKDHAIAWKTMRVSSVEILRLIRFRCVQGNELQELNPQAHLPIDLKHSREEREVFSCVTSFKTEEHSSSLHLISCKFLRLSSMFHNIPNARHFPSNRSRHDSSMKKRFLIFGIPPGLGKYL